MARSVGSLPCSDTSGVGGEADISELVDQALMTQLDRWRRDFGAPQQRRGHLLGLSSPAVYRARNLSENLSVALDQKFGLAKITPPEAGPRCSRLRTGSKRSACPSTRSALPRTALISRSFADLTDQDLERHRRASLGHRRKLLRAIADLKDVEKSNT